MSRNRLLAIAAGTLAAAAQAAPDTKLLDAATRAQPAVIDTLKSLVLIETGSHDAAGLESMANLLEERLKALGCATERRKATAGAGADIVIGTLAGTGRRKVLLVPMARGATDAAFAARSGKATVVESFGLAGHGYHARDEYIEVDSIVPRLYLVARLLMDLGKP